MVYLIVSVVRSQAWVGHPNGSESYCRWSKQEARLWHTQIEAGTSCCELVLWDTFAALPTGSSKTLCYTCLSEAVRFLSKKLIPAAALSLCLRCENTTPPLAFRQRATISLLQHLKWTLCCEYTHVHIQNTNTSHILVNTFIVVIVSCDKA